ncbi:hypothetical protein C8R47DRAFT_1088827 [Mycena vitilis]|nr:hypothetical protein C8R47DRAFT_1088827 [Mycena vitilis]
MPVYTYSAVHRLAQRPPRHRQHHHPNAPCGARNSVVTSQSVLLFILFLVRGLNLPLHLHSSSQLLKPLHAFSSLRSLSHLLFFLPSLYSSHPTRIRPPSRLLSPPRLRPMILSLHSAAASIVPKTIAFLQLLSLSESITTSSMCHFRNKTSSMLVPSVRATWVASLS